MKKSVGTIKNQWPADHVERRSVESLIPYARNARMHSEEQVAQLAASIKEWGWTTPVLVDEEGSIIAGHGRVMAARKLGIEEVPVMVARGWSEAQRRAYVLADNKLALNSGWDMDLLKVELQDIGEMSFDLDKIGFSVGEMTNLFLETEIGETNAEDEWKGMPEFVDEDPCFRKVVVNFDSKEDVERFFTLIQQDDTGKTKSIWFPEKEKRDLEGKRWAEDGE